MMQETAYPALSDRDLQRMDGAARVGVIARSGVTALADLYQRSPAKALFPRVDGADCREVVFLNTAGGIAGGDRLHYTLTAGPGATITATTQTAERVYRAIAEPGRVTTRIEAGPGATVEWLPQETIVFERGRLSRETEIHCAPDARVLAMDWLLLGRAASGESVATGDIRDHWRIHRGGRLVFADNFRLGGDIAAQTARASLLGGCTALATLIYCAPDAADHLDRAREAMEGHPLKAGATCVGGLIVCRFAAPLASDLRSGVTSFLKAFRDGLGGFPPALPRVWAS